MPFPRTIIGQLPFKLAFKLDRTFLIALVVIPTIHMALAHLSTSIALEEGVVAVWPSIAIYIAAIILFGYRLLPILWLGELLVNFTLWSSTYPQHGVLVLLIFSLPNTIDALITPFLYKLWIPKGNLFARVQNIFKYGLLILPSPLINTTLGVFLTCWGGAALISCSRSGLKSL
ncbi:MAG: hypothetical protein HC789_03615 [Microcoleus sp. CSU_2_2]|nr:hypothetical protein [Microcoleus sp. SU_5_3]NJS09521.1 hypothetical protein [Microcoleus sp. CSU_2_2]